MLQRIACACIALLAALAGAPVLAQTALPSPAPTSDPQAEHLFSQARAAWRERTDVPYARYGALVRYLHNGHVFDNWWDVYYRSSDGALNLTPLLDIDEQHRRLGGVPFSIFGLKIFDTNPDAEPIRLDAPRIEPNSSFGILSRGETLAPVPTPEPVPSPRAGDELREISRIEASARDYQISIVGTESLQGIDAIHLKLVPLREPSVNRLRDVWLDPTTYRTVQLAVQGILNGKPYDGVLWTVRYVLVDGRQYLQQIIADEPLRFGFDTTIPKFEFDFVDYHFPADVPKYTFDKPF
jgi:hypothetical protein